MRINTLQLKLPHTLIALFKVWLALSEKIARSNNFSVKKIPMYI